MYKYICTQALSTYLQTYYRYLDTKNFLDTDTSIDGDTDDSFFVTVRTCIQKQQQQKMNFTHS